MKRFCAILLSALLLAANAFGQVAVRPELNLDAVRQAAASSRSLFLDSTGRVSAIETFLTLVRIKGPSGHEEAVRQEVKRLMTEAGAVPIRQTTTNDPTAPRNLVMEIPASTALADKRGI